MIRSTYQQSQDRTQKERTQENKHRPQWWHPKIDPKIFQKDQPPGNRHFKLADILTLGAMLRHITFLQKIPSWATPRCAERFGLRNLTIAGQLRWTHRFLEDRKSLITRRANELMEAWATNGPTTEEETKIRNFAESQESNFQADEELKRLINNFFKHWFHGETKGSHNWKWRAVVKAFYKTDKDQDERIRKTITKGLTEQVTALHPAFKYIIDGFTKYNVNQPSSKMGKPMDRLLLKGEGFIPTPNAYAIVTATLVHSIRNSFLLSFMNGHPGAESNLCKLYQTQMARICADVALQDNLPPDERQAFAKATKDKENVYVPTDKTGKILQIKRSTMAACIEEFIMERRGKAFDTIDDEITLGIILKQHKKRINAAVGTFIEEKTRMEQTWQQTINSRNNFTKAI